MSNFVRGLAMSVSGFIGMSLCLNYSSSVSSPYLVPAGLASITLGVVGFVLMVSGMNRDVNETDAVHIKADPSLDRLERPQIGDSKECATTIRR